MLGELRLEDYELKVSLGYTVRLERKGKGERKVAETGHKEGATGTPKYHSRKTKVRNRLNQRKRYKKKGNCNPNEY